MITRALIIAEPWISLILSGKKTWELRSRKTNIRGRIGLIRKGSGLIVGEVDVVDFLGSLTDDELLRNVDKHQVKDTALFEFWHTPWVLNNAVEYDTPIKYRHPCGAVTWVKVG